MLMKGGHRNKKFLTISVWGVKLPNFEDEFRNLDVDSSICCSFRAFVPEEKQVCLSFGIYK